MFASLLIANRGEIAVRVIRTARRLGIRTIAVHSDADANALHARAADEAVRIGPPAALESYLDVEKVLDAARKSGAEAVHPGYGFLSENAGFAQACAAAGVTFVGPPPAAIRAMGLKDEAKRIMDEAGVPTVPGYRGDNQDAAFLKRKAYEIGYPVLVKAVAGGGGKGMRRVDKAIAFEDALAGAKREASAAFGNDRVLLERFVANPRHIEVQVFADGRGGAVHLGERDCSLQRRHQKVIEEAPAPGLTPKQRDRMGQAACNAALAVGYSGAGTVEFIVDGADLDRFFFMEMNTRLQVEHPVTEMVTGVDLVEWQLRIAAGERLPLEQDEIALAGHAVEARVYAEDPANGFLPSTGTVHLFSAPSGTGVRVDAGVETGSAVSEHYDPMIAKVIAHAPDREAALDRLRDALGNCLVVGPRTNIGFLRRLLADGDFRESRFDTGLIDRKLDHLVDRAPARDADVAAAVPLFLDEEVTRSQAFAARYDPHHDRSPWWNPTHLRFTVSGGRGDVLDLVVDGEPRRIDLSTTLEPDPSTVAVAANGEVFVVRDGHQFRLSRTEPSEGSQDPGDDGDVRAPMAGRVVALDVEEGAEVEKGARLFTIEAMKMEHPVTAPVAGRVASVAVAIGDQVTDAMACLTIEAL